MGTGVRPYFPMVYFGLPPILVCRLFFVLRRPVSGDSPISGSPRSLIWFRSPISGAASSTVSQSYPLLSAAVTEVVPPRLRAPRVEVNPNATVPTPAFPGCTGWFQVAVDSPSCLLWYSSIFRLDTTVALCRLRLRGPRLGRPGCHLCGGFSRPQELPEHGALGSILGVPQLARHFHQVFQDRFRVVLF